MIPALLDALTIFFIVAGLVLLWLNLRVWPRRHTVPKAIQEQAGHLAGMSNTDLATSRARAEECLELAAQSTSQTDKEIWLQMAEKWIELVEDAERGRRISVTDVERS